VTCCKSWHRTSGHDSVTGSLPKGETRWKTSSGGNLPNEDSCWQSRNLAYVDRGAVCYSNRAKTEMLGVPTELIARHGAVSKEVAAAMACGIRQRANVSVGLSVTGIAGPGGGTETKPVGLVYIGLDDGTGHPIAREFRFHGDRNVIKQRSSQTALDLLRRWLLDKEAK
jgi:nicotinamide-nucleotide amidase